MVSVSQSKLLAPITRNVPSVCPAVSTAYTQGELPESLRVQMTPGCRRLAAAADASERVESWNVPSCTMPVGGAMIHGDWAAAGAEARAASRRMVRRRMACILPRHHPAANNPCSGVPARAF